MRVLVTGGFGYLGAQVAQRFGDRGDRVRVFERMAAEEHERWAAEQGFEVVLGDLRRPETLAAACESVDLVVHCAAANMQTCASDPALGLAVNALGARNVLAAASEAGVRRVVYLSTIHVYGDLRGTVDESTTPAPVSDYGVTKLAGEGYCHEFAAAGGVQVVCLRPANGFGPPVFASADCWMLAVNDFCRTAFGTGEIVLRSAGAQRRVFLALSDTVSAIETLADAPSLAPGGSPAAVFDAGAGLSLTIRELAHIAAEVCATVYARPVAVRVPDGSGDVPDDPAVDYRYDRLTSLGYNPATDLRAGIASVAEFVARM